MTSQKITINGMRIAVVGTSTISGKRIDGTALNELEDLVPFVGGLAMSCGSCQRDRSSRHPQSRSFGNHDAWYIKPQIGSQEGPY